MKEQLNRYPFPAFIIDDEGNILYYNDLLHKLVKEDLEEGSHIANVFSNWNNTISPQIVTAVYDNHSFLFLRERMNQHHIIIGINTPELFSLITENEELKKLNRELDTIIENIYDGIYITDNKGITLKTNSAIEKITGIPKEYYIGKSVEELMKRGILKNSVTNLVLKKKGTVSLVQKNFEGNETILTGTPVFNDKKEIEKVVTTIRDLSYLNKLQKELSRANKLKDEYKKEIERLKSKSNDESTQIISKSTQMKTILELAERIKDIDANVLILGETGVGKDVLANFIYNNSKHSKNGKFVKINCGAIPPDLLESELFGYEGGAFTGANKHGKKGLFEIANNGVLFLDEIADLPLRLQVKLLRVLQDGEIKRVGGTATKHVNVRIISATNKSIKKMVEQGNFREDLFYRLHVIPIYIPPLRDRQEDIFPLIEYFLKEVNKKYGLNKELDYDVRQFMLSYHWPGNIRELSNLVERLVVTTKDNVITLQDLPIEYIQTKNIASTKNLSLKDAIEHAEKEVLTFAYKTFKNTYEMAKALQTSQPTIVRKLKKYKIRDVQQ